MDDRVIPAALTLVAFLVIVALMWLGWRRRRRSQSGLAAPLDVPASLGRPLGTWNDVHYVSTSRTGDALDRIVVAPLGYRGRSQVTVAEAGVVVHIAGERGFFIPRAALETALDGTVTIDRVVESGGLTVLRWTLPDETTSVETSLRIVDAGPRQELRNALLTLQQPRAAAQTEESA